MNPSFAPAPEAAATACAPCGPECRHAQTLPLSVGDFIWCERFGAVRSIGARAAECRWFGSRSIDALRVPINRLEVPPQNPG